MLTVWSVCIGTKYHPAYVYALRDMVRDHLTIPHQFKCITTRKMPGISCVTPFVPYQSWWSKINLFTPGMTSGPNLYFDLDVAICGSLDYLAEYANGPFAAPANWAQSGHGGIQSSVMAWNGNWTRPFNEIQWPQAVQKYWGDQEYLWDLLGDDWIRIPRVCSYKYHCRQSVPEDASVIVFHGDPKPLVVQDPWILPYTSILHLHIKKNMDDGFVTDSALSA